MEIVSTLLFISKVIFQNTRHIKSFFPYKDRLNRSQLSKAIYKASCWDYYDFYIGKTKQRLHDRKTEHFKAFWKGDHSSAITDHVKTTGHGVILRFCCPANLTTIVKLRRPCLFRSCSQHLMSMSAVKSFYFIRKAFPLSHFTDSICLKRLKFLLQMFSV